MDVAAWLRSLGMERYEMASRENAIDADVLRNLTADDLKELGITSIGHRRKLLDALDELRAQTRPPRAAVVSVEAKGERRQVAVLFADLCGFTEMSQEVDPEDVLAVLDRCLKHGTWRCLSDTRAVGHAASRQELINGRAVRGGNTHQQPSSCRKKKMACEPFEADASTRT